MNTSTLSKTRALRAGLLILSLAGAPAWAEEQEAPPDPSPMTQELLKKMKERGVLTEDEYDDLYRRQALDEKKAKDDAAIPGWLEGWSFGGDLRLRLERLDWRESPIVPDRPLQPGHDNIDFQKQTAIERQDRARIRLRLGAEKQVLDGLDVGFRLVTASEATFGTQNFADGVNYSTTALGDPRSSNQTLGNDFSYKGIYLDRAYLRWKPWFARSLSLEGGKIPNPFVSGNFPDSLVWDPDIQPEGVGAQYHFDFSEYLWSDTRAGAFVLDEVGRVNTSDTLFQPIVSVVPTLDENDAYMYAVQQEFTAQIAPWLRAGARASYYDLKNLNTRFSAAVMQLGNTGDAISHNPLYILNTPGSPFFSNGRSNGRMQQIVLDGYFTWNGLGDRWQVTPFVQWTFMPNASFQDQGWTAGLTLGDDSLLKITVQYARIEANSTVALFTDSDFFDGFTNAKGWKVTAERALARGVRLRAAYMDSRIIQPLCLEAPAGRPLAYCNNGAFTTSEADFGQSFETNLSRYRVQLDLLVDF